MPDSNVEAQLKKLNGESVELPEPRSRVELYLAKINGESVELPEPHSRVEKLLFELVQKWGSNGLEFLRDWYKVWYDDSNTYGYITDDDVYVPTVIFDVVIPEFIKNNTNDIISLSHCGNERTVVGKGVEYLKDSAYNMSGMVSKLESIYFPKLSLNTRYTFANNGFLRNVTLKNISKAYAGQTAFANCINLENLTIIDDVLGVTLYLYWSDKLTQECLHHLIEKYAGYTGTVQLTFWIGEENIAKIDEAHIKILNDKNINYK